MNEDEMNVERGGGEGELKKIKNNRREEKNGNMKLKE